MPEPMMDLLRLRTTPPAVPPGFLDRPRLDESLTVAASRPLTVLCAGPGHGKTLTLASWTKHRGGENFSWLSLDDTDNDPQAFWFDLLGALTINGAIPPESSLRDLIPAVRFDTYALRIISSGLAALRKPVVLVLDDFHTVTDRRVLRSFEQLLDQQLPRLHIILSTRADPALRLQRRRVAGELTDIRANDLAFTESEAGKLLADSGIHLTGNQLGALLTRTQGWAAGLRLAILSMDLGDIDCAIDRFTGNDGLVAEYLLEEVLDRVPAGDRQFLLATSVAERVSPALANHLTGRADSQLVLERLVAQNALLLELASGADWFGYHPMLRELLLRRLDLEQPDMVADLHRRAARWFENRGDSVPAIRHACQARDWELVAHVLAVVGWPLALTPSGPGLATALEPAALMAVQDPTAHTLLAAAVFHYQRHEFPSMRRECDDAARLIDEVSSKDRVAVQALIGTLRIAHSRIVNPADTEGAALEQLTLLDRATGRLTPTAEHHRVIATNNLAVGQLWAGDFEQAASNLHAAQARCHELGITLTELSVHGHLALLDVIHGRLPAAAQRTGIALSLADRRGWSAEPQVLGLRAAKAMVNLEQGRLAACGETDDHGLADSGERTDIACRLLVAVAVVDTASAQGDRILADEAAIRLDSIQAQGGRLPPLLAGWCIAARATADLTAGRYSAVFDRIRDADVGSVYPQALGALVVAKARLLLDQPQQAMDALHSLLSMAPRFRGPAVEARVLAAVAAERMHRDTAAMTAMTEAIGLAHRVGLIRPFVSAGPQVAGLIGRYRHVVARHGDFTTQLAAAVAGDHAPSPEIQPVLERFTQRELAVLAYLPTMLTSAEIATDLFVTVNTVKTHQHAIYRKLGVNSRRDAVDRARSHRLLH